MSRKQRNVKKYAVKFKTDKRVQELEEQLVQLKAKYNQAVWRATSVDQANVGLEVDNEYLREAVEEAEVANDLLYVQLDALKSQLGTSIRACNAFSEDADKYYRLYEAAQEVAENQAIAFYEWKDKLQSRTVWMLPLTFAAGGLLGLASMYFQLGV